MAAATFAAFAAASSPDAEPMPLKTLCEEFDPVREACWLARQQTASSAACAPGRIPYAHVAAAMDLLAQTKSRLEKERVLTNLFRTLMAMGARPAELAATCYLLSPEKDSQTGGHRLRPDWEDCVLNVGGRTITAAVLEATGASKDQNRRAYEATRDQVRRAVGGGGGRWAVGGGRRAVAE